MSPARALACLMAALVPATGSAEGLRLDPIVARIPANRQDTHVWLENTGSHPWTGTAALYHWDQHDDAERLGPATGLVASPQTFAIAPGQRQRLRLVRLQPAPAAAEAAYRLVLSEDPRDTVSGEPLQRYSSAVFLDPEARLDPARIRVEVASGPAGPVLWLHNAGERHARLSELAYVDAGGGEHTLIEGLAGYVLGGARRHWPLPARADGYRGGGFKARLGRSAPAPLPLAPGQIAPAAGSGL